MPDFAQSLQGRDLGHLKIIAELWGVELDAPDARRGLALLVELLLDKARVMEMLGSLPEGAKLGLRELAENGGRLTWTAFTRKYGEVREMGAARRDREKPYADPQASVAEALWYRGLVGKAFFDSFKGPEEYAFIPEDLLGLLPFGPAGRASKAPGRPAVAEERKSILLATDRILDDACTLLAGLRMGLDEETLERFMTCASDSPTPLNARSLRLLLLAAGLIDAGGVPLPEQTRDFLESGRGAGLLKLASAWQLSAEFNELKMLPGVTAEGEWKNDPVAARRSVIELLTQIPEEMPPAGPYSERPFWSLEAFVSAIHESHPDFQRPAGDYDSWYLVDERDGSYLRGFQFWDQVDGALIRYLVTGPLHWLGILDLGCPESPNEKGRQAAAFRFTRWSGHLLSRRAAPNLPPENEPLIIQSDGRLVADRLMPRAARYQVARFCEWEAIASNRYRYALTPTSLKKAQEQGLSVQHLLAIFNKYGRSAPPSLVEGLKRWEKAGSEARFEKVTLLRVRNPEILQALRNSRASRFLGEPLGPAAVIIRAGSWKKVSEVLAEMGYLAEVQFSDLEDRPKKKTEE